MASRRFKPRTCADPYSRNAKWRASQSLGDRHASFHAVPEILRLTTMIAVLPRRLAMTTHDLVIIPMPLTVPGFTKSMAWHARRHQDPAHRWLRALCVEVSQQDDITLAT
ncbi:LysR substrate-binding domain-containing protein [Rosenbergiella epipactidis]|uniref:LysR substrate-binding domain-containing protein n=1 Tax=Rosenbergiella epipactidis TaxID=1544694 RepID=UPI0030C894FE